jgi:hypothetical protein
LPQFWIIEQSSKIGHFAAFNPTQREHTPQERSPILIKRNLKVTKGHHVPFLLLSSLISSWDTTQNRGNNPHHFHLFIDITPIVF